MKILLAFALILSPWSLIHPSTTTMSLEEMHIDRICVYHATLLTDATYKMLEGAKYSDAFEYAINRFELVTEQQFLNEVEEALSTTTVEETQMIGKVTGLATILWYSAINRGTVISTYESLYEKSYTRCVTGARENGIVEHFELYEEAIKRMERKANPIT